MAKKKETFDEDEYQLSESKKDRKKSKNDLLSQLDEINQDDYVPSGITTSASSFLPSSLLKDPPEKKKKEDEDKFDDDIKDNWFDDWVAFDLGASKKKKKKQKFDLFGTLDDKGKKKKKKSKDGKTELVDYKKEFEPEVALYKNLLMEQTKFTESLQKSYDSMMSAKGSARGVTKQATDLVANINTARQLSMQLVKENVNIKKIIADLNIKQQKEFGTGSTEGENMSDFANTYIKKMLDSRHEFAGGDDDPIVEEYTEDEIYDQLDLQMASTEQEFADGEEASDFTTKYLEYENRNVEIYVIVNDGDMENYEFEARDENGIIIDDYPMPMHTQLSFNRSTNIAIDTLGQKYPLEWNE